MTINTFFIIYKGAKGLGLHKTPIDVAFGLSVQVISNYNNLLVPKLKDLLKIKF